MLAKEVAEKNADEKEIARLEAERLRQLETIARMAAEKTATEAEVARVKAFRAAVE